MRRPRITGFPPDRQRAELTSEVCILEVSGRKHHFVRGRLEIPVFGEKESFAWLVWASLSEVSFQRTVELWDTEGREAEPPMFGWLSDHLPYSVPTLNLKTRVHTRPVGQRPFVELEPTEHPLAVEQREGIRRERVLEIAEFFMHPKEPAG